MKTPRTLSSAIGAGYVIKGIDYGRSKKCLVKLEPRFYNQGMKALISFWISSAYVKRNYSGSFNKLV